MISENSSETEIQACERVMSTLVIRFGWNPNWAQPAVVEEILVAAHEQAMPVTAIVLERVAIRCYCSRWYAACQSENPFQQRDAFSALHAYLFRTARYMAAVRYNTEQLYADQMAADSAQDTLLLIWKSLHQVKQPESFLSWVKLIVTREVLHQLQKERDMDSLDAEDSFSVADNSQFTTAAPEEPQTEEEGQVEEAIRRCLRDETKVRVVVEHLLNNKTLKQVAELLGKKPDTVRVLKHRAVAQLKKCEGMHELMHNKANQAEAQAIPKNLRHLFDVLADTQDQQLTCQTVEAWLPAYLDDELAGENVAAKYPDVKRHLDLCPTCEQLYVDLLTLALDEQAGALAGPANIPTPDLSFLPQLPSPVTLARHFVKEVTQRTLHLLAPQALPDLATLGELFFRRVEALSGQLPVQRAPVAALGDEDATTAALVVFTVAYRTTQQMAKTFSPQALQQMQSRQGNLRARLLETAQQVAQGNGMNAVDAQVFAQMYADEVQQAPDVWFALVEGLH